jgi:hypothetical protein
MASDHQPTTPTLEEMNCEETNFYFLLPQRKSLEEQQEVKFNNCIQQELHKTEIRKEEIVFVATTYSPLDQNLFTRKYSQLPNSLSPFFTNNMLKLMHTPEYYLLLNLVSFRGKNQRRSLSIFKDPLLHSVRLFLLP